MGCQALSQQASSLRADIGQEWAKSSGGNKSTASLQRQTSPRPSFCRTVRARVFESDSATRVCGHLRIDTRLLV